MFKWTTRLVDAHVTGTHCSQNADDDHGCGYVPKAEGGGGDGDLSEPERVVPPSKADKVCAHSGAALLLLLLLPLFPPVAPPRPSPSAYLAAPGERE